RPGVRGGERSLGFASRLTPFPRSFPMMTRRDALAVPVLSLLPGALGAADAVDPTLVYTGGKKPTDVRLGPPKNLNGYFPFAVPKTKEAWAARRQLVRERVLV